MKSPRLTLFGLMGVIGVIALMLAAFRNPSALVASVAWTGTLTILIVAALVAVLDPRRTFWVGFAVVGLLFAGFASQPIQEKTIEVPLLTSHLLRYVYMLLSNSARVTIQSFWQFEVPANRNWYGNFSWTSPDVAFVRIGDSFAALFHACVGGLLALFIRARLNRPTRSKSDP